MTEAVRRWLQREGRDPAGHPVRAQATGDVVESHAAVDRIVVGAAVDGVALAVAEDRVHADAGGDDAAARSDGRAHALQTEDEQRGRDEVARLYRRAGAERAHQCVPFGLAAPLLLLNISSMRSVTA